MITTIAGNGIYGYSGNGVPATSAELGLPMDVAVDSAGDFFIADAYNNVVREVHHTTGLITTIAGNGICGYSGNNGQATSADSTSRQPSHWTRSGIFSSLTAAITSFAR